MPDNHRLLADGRRRALVALRARLRAEVDAEFADRLADAGVVGRLVMKWKMRRVLKRRLDEKAPRDGLY
jgi:hypothetical protein